MPFLLAMALLAPGVAQSGIDGDAEEATIRPASAEFRPDDDPFAFRIHPALAVLPDHGEVLVWDTGSNVFGRRYREGKPLGPIFQVNAFVPGSSFQTDPSVCSFPDGHFVVAWAINVHGVGLAPRMVAARFFARNGEPLSPNLQVSTGDREEGAPRIACGERSAFVVWAGADGDGQGVVGRLLLGDGSAMGKEIGINSFEQGTQSAPAVAAAGDGGFIVAWQSFWQEVEWDVFARRIDRQGRVAGPETRINGDVAGSQEEPGLAVADSGEIVVVWTDWNNGKSGVRARAVSADGQPFGSDVQVNAVAAGRQVFASVAALSGGRFVVIWQREFLKEDSSNVLLRLLRWPELAAGAELVANSYLPGRQDAPAISSDGALRFSSAWQSGQQAGQSYGVYGREFEVAIEPH